MKSAFSTRAFAGRLFAGLALIALIVSLAPVAEAQVAIGRGRLQGVVSNAAGEPVAGALITLTHGPTGESVSTETDDDGRWVKGNLGFGAWTILATAPGYAGSEIVIRVGATNRREPVEQTLQLGSGDPAESAATSLFQGELGAKISAANELFTAGDYAGAQAAFEAVIAEENAKETPNPMIYYVHLNAGNAAFEQEDYETAATHYRQVLEADEENRDARMALAQTFLMKRELDQAIAELEKIDLTGVTDPLVFYNIGSLLFDQGQSADAQRYYAMAIERDPNFVDAHMQIGLALVQQSKMEEAKPHFEKVIELDPESENAALAQQFLDMISG